MDDPCYPVKAEISDLMGAYGGMPVTEVPMEVLEQLQVLIMKLKICEE